MGSPVQTIRFVALRASGSGASERAQTPRREVFRRVRLPRVRPLPVQPAPVPALVAPALRAAEPTEVSAIADDIDMNLDFGAARRKWTVGLVLLAIVSFGYAGLALTLPS